MTDAELQAHREFFEWFKANFKTRFALTEMGGHCGGRYLSGGRIGFSHPDNFINKTLPTGYTGCWLYLKNENDSWTKHFPNSKWFYRRKQDDIKFRLEAWKQSRSQITTLAGINGDIRQVALLTLILQYRPGQTGVTPTP